MYPKNAASPEPIAIGAVVQISDGVVQTSGCTVRIKPIGVAEGDGGGTTAYSTDGVVLYTPTQAETNYTSFILIAKKTGCIPVSVTVVTTSSVTPGTVLLAPVAHTSATIASVTGAVGSVTGAVGSVTGAVGSVTAGVTVTTNNDKSGYSLASTGLNLVTTWTVNITGSVSGSVGSVTGAVGSVTGNVGGNVNGNVTGSTGSVTGAVGSVTGNVAGSVLGNVSGSVGSVTGAVGSVTGSVGSVTGNVGGSTASVAGSVGSVAGNVSGDVAGKVLGGGAGTITGDGVRASSVTGAVGSVTGAVGSVVGFTAADIAIIKAVNTKLDTGLVLDGTVYQWTVNALELAPAGGGGGGGLTAPQAAQLTAIELNTALITSSTRITIAADSGSSITLKIGDDYYDSIDTAKRIEITDADSSIYTLLIAQTTIAFGAGVGPKRDLVTGTVDPLTITHTAAVGAVPAYTTIFVECSVADTLAALVGEYDIQITHASGKKQTVFSGACTLASDFKS